MEDQGLARGREEVMAEMAQMITRLRELGISEEIINTASRQNPKWHQGTAPFIAGVTGNP